jgi:hypothetical protein
MIRNTRYNELCSLDGFKSFEKYATSNLDGEIEKECVKYVNTGKQLDLSNTALMVTRFMSLKQKLKSKGLKLNPVLMMCNSFVLYGSQSIDHVVEYVVDYVSTYKLI